jgi:hypothetical protein
MQSKSWHAALRQKPAMYLGAERSTCEVLLTKEGCNVLTWATYMLVCTSTKLPIQVRLCRNMIHAVSTWILHQSVHELLALANSASCVAGRYAKHLICNHTHQEIMHLLAAGPNVTETCSGFDVTLMHNIDNVKQFANAFGVNRRQPRIAPQSTQSVETCMRPALMTVVTDRTVMFRATVDIGLTHETINFCLKQQVKNNK